MTPASFHETSEALTEALASDANVPAMPGCDVTATEAAAEARNVRRETLDFIFQLLLPHAQIHPRGLATTTGT
jgi:hypothetical protein